MPANRQEVLWHGVFVGLIGYATTAVSVSVGDLMQGRSFFYTVSLMGEWFFYGLQDPALVTVWPGPVFAYNGVHLVAFLAFGLFASWLASVSERGPLFWYAALVLYVMVLAHMLGAVLMMTQPMRAAIPMVQVLVPGLLAATVMGVYLLRVHPQLRHEMSEWVDHTDDHEVVAGPGAARHPVHRGPVLLPHQRAD